MPAWSAMSTRPGGKGRDRGRSDRDDHRRLVCCPACRTIEEAGHDCQMCGKSRTAMVPLVRGLASLSEHDVFGLVHYPGERSTRRVALGLVLFFPLVGIAALAADATVPGLLFALAIMGLPVVALWDARRAGVVPTEVAAYMPPVAPEPVSQTPLHDEGNDHYTPFRGTVRRLAEPVKGAISGQTGVIVRCDIRAGEDAEILARIMDCCELLVESPDGTGVLVTGPIALDAQEYSDCRDARTVNLLLAGTTLLPAEFSAGGWACELLVRDGDVVEVHGQQSGEERPHPLGAGYRSKAMVALVEGQPGRPVRIRVAPVSPDRQ